VPVAPCVRPSQSACLRSSLCQLPTERVRRDEVREDRLPVDLDDGDQLPVARLERWVAVDRNLFQLEAELCPKLYDSRPRPLAEMAARGAIETDYG
jgi:hypothetical protein